MALITAAWLHTPRGVEKGSCLNRPAKGVIVKSVENVVDVVMDYKKIHLHFFGSKSNNSPFILKLILQSQRKKTQTLKCVCENFISFVKQNSTLEANKL